MQDGEVGGRVVEQMVKTRASHLGTGKSGSGNHTQGCGGQSWKPTSWVTWALPSPKGWPKKALAPSFLQASPKD